MRIFASFFGPPAFIVTTSAIVTFVGAAAFLVGCHGGTSTSGTSVPQDGESPSTAIARPKVTAPSNGLAVPSASVVAVVNPEALPVSDGPTGIVEGTVLVRGPDAPPLPNLDVAACPAALDTYGKLFRAGPPRDDGLRPLADAVVAVTGYAGHYV